MNLFITLDTGHVNQGLSSLIPHKSFTTRRCVADLQTFPTQNGKFVKILAPKMLPNVYIA